MNLTGQTIAVCGAGRSGLAAARLACAQGARVTLLDSGDSEKLASVRQQLPEAEMIFGPDAFSWKNDIAQLIVSPGIDLKSPLVAPWVAADVPVIGEIEFAYRYWNKAIIAITGTNGKTTTTELTTHLLEQNGQPAVSGGNYGKPFAEIVMESENWEVAVLELSSFQLESIDQFRPDVSVWMNFAPDHMDRYTAIEDYRQAKLAIYQNQSATDWAIINAANGPDIDLIPQTLSFSAFEDGADFGYTDGQLHFHGEPIADLSQTNLAGKHNAENLMAAMAVGSIRELPFAGMRKAASDYRPPRHRCERVPSNNGFVILNDSKATNVHALETSLRALDGKIILIAGGKQKGLDYTSLKPWLREKVAHFITLGEIRESLAALAEDHCPCTQTETLDAAVQAAFQHVKPNQTILFSPGTSSFDMFNGYEQRGDVFCSLVTQHLAKP
ncbi:MAG: UDP-N-acetylmuramoylalanine--D-glutamate ligase [Verrucomicrobiales bacterium]|jgi:UDP-N-acetylmuramoylalanine--D-glutamate ligase